MAGFGAVDRFELRDSRVLPGTGQRPATLLVVRESEHGLPVTVEPIVRAAGLVVPVGEREGPAEAAGTALPAPAALRAAVAVADLIPDHEGGHEGGATLALDHRHSASAGKRAVRQ